MKKFLKIAAIILAAAAIIALIVWLVPIFASLAEPEKQAEFQAFIESLGVWGIVVMLLLQITQIVAAVIPGEPLELIMGLMYGTAGGLAMTLIGIAVGQTLVFFLIKQFGIGFAKKFVNVEKFTELKFLKNEANRDSLIFLLFFIPGTPKDVLTYFAPFTGIPFPRFILLSTFARIPSVITSTWAGATLSDGNIGKTVIIFAATGVIAGAGILVNRAITKRKSESNEDA
ncbi:MAG: TVP38/TMEM64 family protein [Ruminococcaceae bacterium]|nr:TVP38/TMEM64 family protein [Oscillospiraceae bacterium]